MLKKKKSVSEKGISLNDAFDDDEDVEYAKPKPRKTTNSPSNKKSMITKEEISQIKIKSSKPVSQIKKGDKIKVDALSLEVDTHYILMDHGSTKEMAIECFNPKTDKDYQIRYFSDRVEDSIEFYELDEIVYNRIDDVKVIEW